MKRSGLLIQAATWMNLKVIPSGRSQTKIKERDREYILLRSYLYKTLGNANQSPISGDSKISGCQWVAGGGGGNPITKGYRTSASGCRAECAGLRGPGKIHTRLCFCSNCISHQYGKIGRFRTEIQVPSFLDSIHLAEGQVPAACPRILSVKRTDTQGAMACAEVGFTLTLPI